MKRFMIGTMLVLTFVVVSLTGCSGNSRTDQQVKASDAPKSTTQEKVKLTMGSWRTEDVDAYTKIISEFNKKNPDIEIQFKPTKNTEYNAALNTALQSGSGPDIIHLRPYWAGKILADAGYLEPLDTLKGMDVFSKDALLAATGSNGKVYGVPTVNAVLQVFYNKKIFQKYGLQEPKTWDEFLKIAETLKKNKVTPFAFGSKEGWTLSIVQDLLGPAIYGGNDFVKKMSSGAANFNSKEYVDSIKTLKALTPYFPDNFVGIGMDDMRNLFVTEQAAMMLIGNWEVAVIKKANPNLDFDVFPVPPATAGGKPSVSTWVDGSFAVNAKSPNKQAALKFVEFMTTKDFGMLVANELKASSTIPGIQGQDPIVAKVSKYADTIAVPFTSLVYFGSGNPTTKSALENSLQGMFLDKLTPEQVADATQKSADTWFKPIK